MQRFKCNLSGLTFHFIDMLIPSTPQGGMTSIARVDIRKVSAPEECRSSLSSRGIYLLQASIIYDTVIYD